MSFIQDNVNKKLLILILSISLGIVILTLVYQLSFQDINDQYQTKVQQLNKTFTELTQTKVIINRTKQELLLKVLREEDLSGQYLDLKEEEQQTSAERDELFDVKGQLERQLLDTQRALVAEKHLTADQEKELKDLKERARSRQEEIDSLKAEVTRLKAQGCT